MSNLDSELRKTITQQIIRICICRHSRYCVSFLLHAQKLQLMNTAKRTSIESVFPYSR